MSESSWSVSKILSLKSRANCSINWPIGPDNFKSIPDELSRNKGGREFADNLNSLPEIKLNKKIVVNI